MTGARAGSSGVVVVGAAGRLGSLACRLLDEVPDLHLAHALGRTDVLGPELLEREPATLALEATAAGLGEDHATQLLELGLRPVVATSGVGPEAVERLDARARAEGLGGFVVPNLSLGHWLLQRCALLAAPHLPQVEIVERHHATKRDAPSASALDSARRLRAAGAEVAPPHALRLPGLYAHEEIQLGGPGETLSFRHDMLGPEAFGPGLLAALRAARTAVGVSLGLDHVLDGSAGQP